jgi:hypothetical protein
MPRSFPDLRKSENWYGLLPQMLDIEQKWLLEHGGALLQLLPASKKAYLGAAITLWDQALYVSADGMGHFAAHVLRSILERVAFLWATSKDVGLDSAGVINAYESHDRKRRKLTTDNIIETARSKDSDIGTLYDEMLSRYYSHLSHLDGVSVDWGNKYSKKLVLGAQLLPLLLLFDVGYCLIRVVRHLLSEHGTTVKEPTAGKAANEYSVRDYVRVATYLMCERHSRRSPVSLALLIQGVKGIQGDIGLTDIYRGGMEVCRYGAPPSKPELTQIAEMAIFAVGRHDVKRVVAECKEVTHQGERYELRWPKEWDVSYVAVTMMAGGARQDFPLFDYVTAFVGWIDQCHSSSAT